MLGPLFVNSATRRVMPRHEVAEVGTDSVDPQTARPDEDEG